MELENFAALVTWKEDRNWKLWISKIHGWLKCCWKWSVQPWISFDSRWTWLHYDSISKDYFESLHGVRRQKRKTVSPVHLDHIREQWLNVERDFPVEFLTSHAPTWNIWRTYPPCLPRSRRLMSWEGNGTSSLASHSPCVTYLLAMMSRD